MQSDLKGPRSQSREIVGLKGLMTMAEDSRSLPDGYCAIAQDVIFDKNGNARAKDGSATWWDPISQRQYLSEALPTENWTNGTEDYVDFQFGFSSRYLNSAGLEVMLLQFAEDLDITLGGLYTQAQASVNFWVKPSFPSDITAGSIALTSNGTSFADYAIQADIHVAINAAAAGIWQLISIPLSSFNANGSHPINLAALSAMEISLTSSAGHKIGFDEMYVSFSDYTASFGLGGMEFERITDGARFTLAAFGETVYADLDEAQNPYKILSQLTRNKPTYFDVAEDRVMICNGTDPNHVYTGNSVRKAGFPAPASFTPAFTYQNIGGGSFNTADAYNYGVTFVYGEDGVEFGQSDVVIYATPTNVTAGDNACTISGIPVGAPGSGVIARRLWRSRQGAGALASEYMVTEIAGNTTTSYQDSAPDTSIITAEVAPSDNGIPAVSLMAVWFQKAMVYLQQQTVTYSRVGVDINSDMEIVPAENILAYGQSGQLVGLIEFNGNLYLFSKRGVTALYWQGSQLYDRPVQRTAETRAQNIGAYDGRAITVVQNRYIRWMDNYGQIWKMYPNEQIEPESQHIANLLDNFNTLPLVQSQEHWTVSGQENFNAGTTGGNLTTTEQYGLLAYKDTSAATATTDAGPTVIPLPRDMISPNFTQNPSVDATPPAQDTNAYWHTNNDIKYITLSIPSYAPYRGVGAISLSQINLMALLGFAWAQEQGAPQFNWVLYAPNYNVPDPTHPTLLGAQIASGSCSVTHLPYGDTPADSYWERYNVAVNLPDVLYVPAGEYIVLAIQLVDWAGGTNPYVTYPFLNYSTGYDQSGDLVGFYTDSSAVSSLGFLGSGTQPYLQLSGVGNLAFISGTLPAIELPGAASSSTDTLQRWWKFVPEPDAPTVLRCAQSISVAATFATVAATPFTTPQYNVFSMTETAQTSTIEPKSITLSPLVPVSDYRNNGWLNPPQYGGTAYLYVTFTFPTNPVTPTGNAASRVSTTQSDCLPTIYQPTMSQATEPAANFGSAYGPLTYTYDQWISAPVLMPTGVVAFGNFAAVYKEAQEALSFYIKAATTTAGLAAQPWTEIPANLNIAEYFTAPAGAMYFQVMAVFTDVPGRFSGVPSTVSSLSLSWDSEVDQISPILPPVMYYYKDYTYCSWAGRGSRLPNYSLAVDDYADNAMEQYQTAPSPNRWSQFSQIHYGGYLVVTGKLLGMPVSGGQLVLLRQSAVTEYTGVPVIGFVVSQPTALGTPYLKTVDYSYMGISMNAHANGFFQYPAETWPAPAGSSPVWTPTFNWAVSGSQQAFNLGDIEGTFWSNEGSFDLTFGQAQNGQGGIPFQPEYGTDQAVQERAIQFAVWLYPFLDTNGQAWFPTFTNAGFEWYTENYRGV